MATRAPVIHNVARDKHEPIRAGDTLSPDCFPIDGETIVVNDEGKLESAGSGDFEMYINLMFSSDTTTLYSYIPPDVTHIEITKCEGFDPTAWMADHGYICAMGNLFEPAADVQYLEYQNKVPLPANMADRTVLFEPSASEAPDSFNAIVVRLYRE